MTAFPLQIVTPDGERFHAEAVMVRLRAMDGDIGIRARHVDFVTALGMGLCCVQLDEKTRRYASCIGGVLAVVQGSVRIAANSFEWAEDIDTDRAKAALERAQQEDDSVPSKKGRIQRAQVRLAAAEYAVKK